MSKFDHAPLTPVGLGQNGVALSCDTTSKAATLPTSAAGTTAKYIRVAASGTGYVRLAAATTVAVTTDFLLTSGMDVIWPVPPTCTHFAYASASGTSVIVVTAVEFG